MSSSHLIHTNQDWLAYALALDSPLATAKNTSKISHNETLADFQTAAVTRAVANVRQFGGTILADGVGLGKTRMGLAIAHTLLHDALQTNPSRATIYACIPARLQTTWQTAARTSGWNIPTEIQFITHTELSHRLPDLTTNPPAALLVDEAHHFHNPNSQRSRNLAKIATHCPTVLLTATPICNSIWDLYNLLTLFLAEHDLRNHIGMNLRDAFTNAQNAQFDLTELARLLVIRRRTAPENTPFGIYPDLRLNILHYNTSPAENWIWQNLEHEISQLPLTLLSDNWPRPLFQEFILKRWESSPHALAKTLRNLVDYHRRYIEAQHTGHTLSRADFHQIFPENLQNQTVFPFVYEKIDQINPDTSEKSPKKSLKEIETDLYQLQKLLDRTQQLPPHKSGAITAIIDLLDQIPDQKLLIFTSYQHAAAAIYNAVCKHLGPHARAARVTGRAAHATGLGKTSPQEIIRRFAPIANAANDLPKHQQIDILVATDCLSEGINLQDCNHLVLADLPYTPLRVEQRIGRLMRPTNTKRNVTVHLPRPHDWPDTLELRRRLNTKLNHAQHAGAVFEHASTLSTTIHPKTSHHEPLAALTALDQLATHLNAERFSTFHAPKPLFFTGSHPNLPIPTQLWLRAVFEDPELQTWFWCRVVHANNIETRPTILLPDLLKLARITFKITPAQPDPTLLKTATDALQTRLQHLQAVRFAPMPLAHDSIQQKIWKHLNTPTPKTTHDLNTLRQKILQPFPRGTERILTELLAKNPQSDQLIHHIQQLDLKPPPQPLKLRIAIGLQLTS